MTTRENAQQTALLAYITREDGTRLRPISLGTLTVLQLLGNPLAAWLDTEHADSDTAERTLLELTLDRQTLAEVWYIHAAPLADFLPSVSDGDTSAVRRAALEWAMDKNIAAAHDVLRQLLTEHERVLRTSWGALPQGGRSKNEPSRH